MESKFELVIKIDLEKIRKHGYDYEEVINAVEDICKKCHCVKKSEGVFTGIGSNKDVGYVFSASYYLCEQDWFRKCVQSIEWFAPRGEHIDLIEYHTKQGLVFG